MTWTVIPQSLIVIVVFATVTGGGTDAAGRRAPVRVNCSLRYCVTCHNPRLNTGGLSLDPADLAQVEARAETWEKVVRKLRTGMMPPAGAPRPSPAALQTFTSRLEAQLDARRRGRTLGRRRSIG